VVTTTSQWVEDDIKKKEAGNRASGRTTFRGPPKKELSMEGKTTLGRYCTEKFFPQQELKQDEKEENHTPQEKETNTIPLGNTRIGAGERFRGECRKA